MFTRYPDHESCLERLERVRWGDTSRCPNCGSVNVARKVDGQRKGRWNCHGCKSSFNVLQGTILQKTKVPLQKWFLGIALVLKAKKSLSSCQLARDLDMNQKSAWYMAMRIRKAMTDPTADLLTGIVEADEAYVGGRPRKGNRCDDDKPNKRGRGTSKMAVVGVAERVGKVCAEITNRVNAVAIAEIIGRNVSLDESLLMTDEYKGYNRMATVMRHATIDHSASHAEGMVHTNTIEGFWAFVKRAWYGQHHHYSRRHAPAHFAEVCWKYNNRHIKDGFGAFIRGAMC